LFRETLANHLEDFEKVTETPSWVMFPRWSSGGSRWSDEGPSDNFAEAEAGEREANDKIATQRRAEIVAWLDGLLEHLSAQTVPAGQRTISHPDGASVFLVHGHDGQLKETVARFLERLGLRVTILHEQPDRGRTIVEKFEHHADVSFAVVLLTADDIGGSKAHPENLKSRARQNVVLELGYFLGLLGRSRVCALRDDGVELPSDLDGVLYVPIDPGGAWRLRLAGEIKACGINIDLNRAMVT
jgi:predicted nucleotide-binding protein